MFENARFIKSSASNDITRKTYAPMFRRRFVVKGSFSKASLVICGLGYIYSYINGQKITQDLFTAPVSNYLKTLWYNEYDVTKFISEGENIFAAVCGNGWYNEVITSAWSYDKSEWNDTPKLIMVLYIDGRAIFTSDDEFRVTVDTPFLFNQLRSGEYYDARKYDNKWNQLSFDDSQWEHAKYDTNPPTGEFRKCECEPINECKVFKAISITQIDGDTYVFDFGQNMSGYVRIDTNLPSGEKLVIKYSELLNPDGTRNTNHMEDYYGESEIETDILICNGEQFSWSPRFTYHGFQYVTISGISDINKIKVQGVFVHQDIAERADFECSNPVLTKLYKCGKVSCWSNMFYQMTDCPTREKLGWLNDARASTKQLLTNFEMEKLFSKWMTDITDAMREDGSMPGIAPTCGWGYDWGNGPVSDGILFEIPYQMYIQTGNPTLLKKTIPYFERYLAYLDSRKDIDHLIKFGLPDWAAPGEKTQLPVEFINAVLEYYFLHITQIAKKLNGDSDKEYAIKTKQQKEMILNTYIREGRCIYSEQTAVSMLIYYGIYREMEPLSKQLKELVEKQNYHHNCGMVGLRHLYYALSESGLTDYAVRMITSSDYPSQGYWISLGANTLWELWEPRMSRNHHMYSDFMGWVIDTLLGIKSNESHPGYSEIHVDPKFPININYAKGYVNTVAGRIEVSWERKQNIISVSINVPKGMRAFYGNNMLDTGNNELEISC